MPHFRPERDRNAEEQPMRAASNAGPVAMLKRPAPVTIHDGELTETKVVKAVLISRVGAGADATAGKSDSSGDTGDGNNGGSGACDGRDNSSRSPSWPIAATWGLRHRHNWSIVVL